MRTSIEILSKMGRKDNKEVIHSGHFMMSDFDAIEAQEEEEKEVAKYLVEIPDPDGDKSASDDESAVARDKVDHGERRGKKVKFRHKNVIEYKSSASTAETLSIDGSLTKLFNAMDIAYKQKITSPKWNRFKGLKLRCKDKIRLNNVIWRCWHMQFILKQKMRVCQFALDVDMHNKPEAIVMEGKYWKRHLDTVTAEYKKWRIYYKNKLNGCDTPPHLPTDELLASFDDMDWLSVGGVSSFDDIESCMDLSDILFTSLMNATEPYAFPNPREIARTGNSDLVQPGLVQLQPDLGDFAYVPKMLAGHGSQQHSLPSVPEEDFYSSEVETAGLPPATTNTPPSYASSSSSPQPSSLLDCFHPPSQARLTTIDNASLSPITEHHSSLQRSSTTSSAMPSASSSDFTRPSSDCFYPMNSMSSLHSPMDLCTPDIQSKSPETAHDSFNFSPCLSLVPSSPSSPAAAPQQNSLSHPPSISTPKVFPHSYDNSHPPHHSPEQDLLLGLSPRPSTGDSGGATSSDGPASGPMGYAVHHPSASSPILQSHHQPQFQQQLPHRQEHRVIMGRSHSGSNPRLSPNHSPLPSQQHPHQQQHQVLKGPDHSSPIHDGGDRSQHRIYVKSLSEQNMAAKLAPSPSSSAAGVCGGTTLTHSRHQSSSSPSSHSSSARESRRKGEYFAVPKQYPKRRSSYSGAPGNGNRKSPISQSSQTTQLAASSLQHVASSSSLQHQLSSPHGQRLSQGGGDIHLGRTVAASTAASASPVSSAAGWNVLSTESVSRNPRLIAPATLAQPVFTAFVTKGEPGEPSSSSSQPQDGNNNGNNHVLLTGGPANGPPNSGPVKLSLVFPNVSPPALIPLTTVTPLTTADALAPKALESGTRTISLAPVQQATFASPNSFNRLPFLPASSSNTHTPRSTSLTTLTPLPGGGTTFFATPLSFTTSASGVTVVPATNTVTSRSSNPRSQIAVTLPNVTLSAVTPSSLKSIPQTQQVLFSSSRGADGTALSSGGANNQFSASHVFKTSPPYLGPSSPLPSPPNKAFRPKNDQERVQYREHRRVCHINAEKKRRCSIKSNFEMLHSLIPSITNTPNSKISKAALLHKGADYIQQLKNDRQQLAEKIDLAKQELENLSAQISTAQSQLPATGAPMSHSRHNQLGQMYKEYVRERTLNHSWKFYIFSLLGETLLQSFNANVSTASVEDLSRSSLAWLDQHCSLNLLRPVVSSKMLQLSQQTSVLSNPQLLPEEIYHLVTKQEDKNNSNSGSSSNSSRSSSLVRM